MPEKGCDSQVPDETIIPQFISCESPSLVEKVERNHEEESIDKGRYTKNVIIIPQFISFESASLVKKVERNREEGSVDKSRDTDDKSVVQGCAVETRASAMKPRIVKPLVVPGVVVTESSEED